MDRLIADRYFGILACYLRDGNQVFETYWTSGRGDEVMAPSYGLLDPTVYGRQEFWEDSPEGRVFRRPGNRQALKRAYYFFDLPPQAAMKKFDIAALKRAYEGE